MRLAWLYLKRLPPAEALARFSEGLRRFAAALGKAGLYHETITWAYLLLIRERMEREGPAQTWSDFAARQPGPSDLEAVDPRRVLPRRRRCGPTWRGGSSFCRTAWRL